jgi:hypothetical protein
MMERGIILALCTVVSFTFAQPDQAKNPAPPQPAAPAKPAQTKATEQGIVKVLAGSIANINQENKSITIRMKSVEYPVSIDETTILKAGDKQMTIADFKQGDRVRVEYRKFSNGGRKAINVKDFTVKNKPAAQAQPAPKPKEAAPKAEPAAAATTPAKAEVKAAPAASPASLTKADSAAAAAQPAVKTTETAPVKK